MDDAIIFYIPLVILSGAVFIGHEEFIHGINLPPPAD
jgi:hypothetical protein